MNNSIRRQLKVWAWSRLSSAKGFREFVLDARRYQNLSTPSSRDILGRLEGRQLEGQITKDYHRIEKGLALNFPKRPFGADAEERLSLAFASHDSGRDNSAYKNYADDALQALNSWNQGGEIADLVSPRGDSIPRTHITPGVLDGFFKSRRSVRAFDKSREIDENLISRAVSLAGNSPSVCNRQTWKAHYYSGSEDVARILKHQSGNRGFGSDASGVIIITSDVRLFSGSGERNQRWVDGGLFAMSVVWALHGLGVATCMLNWSKGNAASDALRAEAALDINEDVIVLIAVGHPVPNYRVARSERRPLSEIFQAHSR